MSKSEMNVIAKIRSTSKGKKMVVHFSQASLEIGREGTDGRGWHKIVLGQDGTIYCTCPAWKYQKSSPASRSCKHLIKAHAEIPVLAAHGVKYTKEISICQPAVWMAMNHRKPLVVQSTAA